LSCLGWALALTCSAIALSYLGRMGTSESKEETAKEAESEPTDTPDPKEEMLNDVKLGKMSYYTVPESPYGDFSVVVFVLFWFVLSCLVL
jgi:hypothetical protein